MARLEKTTHQVLFVTQENHGKIAGPDHHPAISFTLLSLPYFPLDVYAAL
jgi:hypothetical protein